MIEENLVLSTLHKHSAVDHEPSSDQNIITLKGKIRSTVHSIPYRKMPLLMIESIVRQAQYLINAFTSKTGTSTTM